MRKPRLHLGCGPSSFYSNPRHACHAFLLLFVTGVWADSLYFDVEAKVRCQSGPSQGRSTGTQSSSMSRRLFDEGSHHVRRTEDGRQGEQLNKAGQRLLGPFPRPHLGGLRDHSRNNDKNQATRTQGGTPPTPRLINEGDFPSGPAGNPASCFFCVAAQGPEHGEIDSQLTTPNSSLEWGDRPDPEWGNCSRSGR
ncbi:hypothetical protein CGRA01v4_07092 [Colletotrichum graminicola]|nr:hypothetical protein CGRA01v4_07092 [Colletotrichum graminicola]